MATNASVQAYADSLARALARARAAGAQAAQTEAEALRKEIANDLGSDKMGKYIAPHIVTFKRRNGMTVTIRVNGNQATIDAHRAEGKPAGKDFDLALEREFGSQKVPAKPFFYSRIRSKASVIAGKIGSAMYAALFDEAAETDVNNSAGFSNPTAEPGDHIVRGDILL